MCRYCVDTPKHKFLQHNVTVFKIKNVYEAFVIDQLGYSATQTEKK